MLFFFLKKISGLFLTLFFLLTATFFLMKAIPGGPFDSEKALPAEVKKALEQKYHLDKPVFIQYADYLRQVVQGDFGPSYRYLGSRNVSEVIGDTFWISAKLGLAALLLALLVGVPLGVLAAYKKNSWIDSIILFFSVAGLSLPSFVLASLFILLFSLKLQWLPPALWEGPGSAVLPVLTLALRPLALFCRLVRVSMIEVLSADYVRTAKSKGLSTQSILFKHALKNALIPLLTLVGPTTASLVTGSLVVEMMFAIPGMGKHFVSAVLDRDYTLILGVTLVYGALLVGANFLVDTLYTVVDPRIREEKSA